MEKFLIDKNIKTALIVGIQKNEVQYNVEKALLELESLLKTLNISTKYKITQKKTRLSSSHLLGWGKVIEVKDLSIQSKIDIIVIDHQLSGPQIRNLSRYIQLPVIDRAGIILEIFHRHAKTKQAKTKVEIAQLEYLLPRLSGAWTHFQRQTGGKAYSRGMGETQLEVDRRRARQRINILSKRLQKIKKESIEQRKSRSNQLQVAIVGYTNSGKTSIMHALTKISTSGVDELFATLEPCTRSLSNVTKPKILLSDTVGFIKDLPNSLLDSFRTTLEEAAQADLFLHVVDLSHQDYIEQITTTEDILDDVAKDVPKIYAFNKIDLVDEPFLAKILKKKYPLSIAVSALNVVDMKKLRDFIVDFFKKQFQELVVTIPSSKTTIISYIHQNCIIAKHDYNEDQTINMVIRASQACIKKIQNEIAKTQG